jgi:hypothetical protein
MEWTLRPLGVSGSIAIALMGAVLRLWPPSGEAVPAWGVAFFLVGIATLTAVIWEAMASHRAQKRRDAEQNERTLILLRAAVQAARKRRVPRFDGPTKLWLGDWELEVLQPGGPPFGRTAGSQFLLRIDVKGRVLVSGDIYAAGGRRIMASLHDSEFESVGQLASDYDCNADADAFEIVDEGREPVLQVTRRNGGGILVNAFWRFRDGEILVARQGETYFDLFPNDAPRPALRRVFTYPSTLYPGVRE